MMRAAALLSVCLLSCLAPATLPPAPAAHALTACPAKDSRPWAVRVAAQARPCVVEIRAPQKVQGAYKLWGAGWAVRGDLVVTCAHVVGRERLVRLATIDGKGFEANVVQADPGRDVAFIRPRGKCKLPVLKLVSKPAAQGEDVLALGHPFEHSWTVTRGIVAAVGRQVTLHGNELVDLVQIDAPINPGNSGGPLLNDRGEVIGMASCLYAGAQSTAFGVSAKSIASLLKGP